MNTYLALLVSAYLAMSGGPRVNQTEWEAYKLAHGKHYADLQVDQMRSLIHAHNKQQVEAHADLVERKLATHRLAVNQFSDRAEPELLAAKLNGGGGGGTSRVQNTPEAEAFLRRILQDDSIEVPDELDWRQAPGRVSSVKDDGRCSAAWAFAAVGALEGQQVVRVNASLKEPIELSAQNLVDCNYGDSGCGGGWIRAGFETAKLYGGIDDAQSYPYDDFLASCAYRSDRAVMNDTGYAQLTPAGDEQALKALVAKFGPVAVQVHATGEWFHYRDGVFTSKFCDSTAPQHLNHAVLVVGYGTDKEGAGGDYWILKNSWGADWGDAGYMLHARNKQNHCAIASMAVIPTF